MPQAYANGLDIEYELAGPEIGPVILLIMGLAAQMTAWPDEFLADLHAAGYRTLRFDNRDIGKSQKIHDKRPPNIVRQMVRKRIGLSGGAPYRLEDMAKDAESLLNALGIRRVHVVGVSMGGMIAQIFAAKYADRTLSFTGIMTTTNNRTLPAASREIRGHLLKPAKMAATRQEAIERSMMMWGLIGTKNSGASDDDLRARIEAAYDRSNYPVGPRRQISAIGETGDLRRYTRKITAPTLVIHGDADPLVPKEGGMDIAKNIPGSTLELIEGMGHDLPKKHLKRITSLLVSHMRAAMQPLKTEAAE